MMNEFTPPTEKNREQTSSLYIDEIGRSIEYFPPLAPRAVTVLNMHSKGYLDDYESRKQDRCHRTKVGTISKIFLSVLIVASILAIFVISVLKTINNPDHPDMDDDSVRVETQLDVQPEHAAVPDLTENKTREDLTVDHRVCVPMIKFNKEIFPESIPTVASDGNTIAVKQGNRLNFYEQDRSESSVRVSITQTRTQSEKSHSPSPMTLALDGTTIMMGDYMRDKETGAIYIMDKTRASALKRVILAPDDVDDGGMFGFSIDIFNDRMIVGAPYGYGKDSGSAYVYERTAEGGWELGDILPPAEEDGPEDEFELFGESVAIQKGRAAVSGFNEHGEVTVFIYEYSRVSDSWDEIDDIIVDTNCRDCTQVGVSVSFRDDGGLFISYPRKNTISYLVPTTLGDARGYVIVQNIYVDEDNDIDMNQVRVSGGIMVVGVLDQNDVSLVFVYSQSNDDGTWVKVDEIELPANKNFDPNKDFIDLALTRRNLMVNYGDDELIWYTFDGCD
ncbi:hypothetical protein ACHAW6_002351 [Cyclotella cf. meneghiniana]